MHLNASQEQLQEDKHSVEVRRNWRRKRGFWVDTETKHASSFCWTSLQSINFHTQVKKHVKESALTSLACSPLPGVLMAWSQHKLNFICEPIRRADELKVDVSGTRHCSNWETYKTLKRDETRRRKERVEDSPTVRPPLNHLNSF